MNKLIAAAAGLALLLSIIGLVGGNQPAASLGGFTNYDAIAIGTSSNPGVPGDIVVDGPATSTLSLTSSTASRGGCIQIDNSAGTLTAVYVVGTTVTATAGACR